ncbi:hypothetical protein J6A31_06480 [bacterium]|nr:hypothetical protein [bacterium]
MLTEIKNTLNSHLDIVVLKLANDRYTFTIFYYGDYEKDKADNCIDYGMMRLSCKCNGTDICIGLHDKDVFIDMQQSGPFRNIHSDEELNKFIENLTFAQNTVAELKTIIATYF